MAGIGTLRGCFSMTALSPFHLPLIAVGVGFHVAVAWALFWRYFQARERSLLTWGIAWLVLSIHVLGMYLTRMGFESASILRDVSLSGAALAFFAGQVEREGRAFRQLTSVAAGAAVAVAAAVVGGSLIGAPVTIGSTLVVILCMGGAAYLSSPTGSGSTDITRWLLFAGYVMGGLHALGYLLPLPGLWAIRLEIFGHAFFSLLFSAAVTWQAWEHERAVRLFSRTLERLNRPLSIHESLDEALHLVADVLRVTHGWILLREGGRGGAEGGWTIGSAIGFQNWALTGLRLPEYSIDVCLCLRPVDRTALVGTIADLACVRLSDEVGRPSGRHVTIPLGANGQVQGIMVLLVPPHRFFAPADVELLTAMGEQIGLAIDRSRAYDELRAKEEARGRLVQQLITAQEDERRRIARELHDETGQALTALVVNLDFLVRHQPMDEEVMRQRLSGVRDMAEATLAEVRRVIHEMRPTVLDDLGLEAAIKWLVKKYEPSGLGVAVEVRGLERRLPGHVEITVFRVVQEACTNTIKHANAKHLQVRVVREGDRVTVDIADDGRGIHLDSRSGSVGLGLAGLRERVGLAGGTVTIGSGAGGHGTRIYATLPAPREANLTRAGA
jgi:signal transduction histidine kinase